MLHKSFNAVFIGLITAMIVVSAYIRVPMYPIPFTLQAYVIYLIPMVFGTRRAFLGVLFYIILGLIGLPIFASGGGIAYILMPSFGYIIGYLISVIPAGIICKRFNNIRGYVVSGIVSLLIIDIVGSIGLYININFVQGKEMLLLTAFKVGFVAFIIPDLIKVFGAVVTAPVLYKVMLRCSSLFETDKSTVSDKKHV